MVLFGNWKLKLLLSGDLHYVNKEKVKALKHDTGEVEKMPEALITSQENKRLPQ